MLFDCACNYLTDLKIKRARGRNRVTMGKSLVIVESPAKAKTINKYLGKDFIVKSSVGHVRDLPTGARAATGKKLRQLQRKG